MSAPFDPLAFDGVVCDLDGVVYRGDEPIPGAVDALARLRARGCRVVFCTNNSRVTVEGLLEKLTRLGVETDADHIVTSAMVTAEVLKGRGMSGARAAVIGGEGIRRALTEAGIEIDDGVSSLTADVVVVGLDPQFDYEAMRRAAILVRKGALFVATNDDAAYPAPTGLWPGAGAILASIEVASGEPAEVMGKPHPPMLDTVAARLGDAGQVVAVGDRLETDLVAAGGRGWKTVLVLSGVTNRAEAARALFNPDWIVDSLAEFS